MTSFRTASPPTRPTRWTLAFLLLLAVIGTGCSGPAEEDRHAIAVGEDGSVGSVKILSVLLVSADEGEPARLLGTLENETDEPLEVTISDDDDSVVVSVPANAQYPFDTNEAIFETAGDAPGANTTITAEADGETAELVVPIVDGTLERYRPYLPRVTPL